VKPSPLVRQFGERLRELREARKLSQEKLGVKARLHRNAIGQIERAEIRATIETLEKLAHALGVEPVEFFTRSGT
jgi:XRE family transcriptional regulator, regulator of sulfur utilization